MKVVHVSSAHVTKDWLEMCLVLEENKRTYHFGPSYHLKLHFFLFHIWIFFYLAEKYIISDASFKYRNYAGLYYTQYVDSWKYCVGVLCFLSKCKSVKLYVIMPHNVIKQSKCTSLVHTASYRISASGESTRHCSAGTEFLLSDWLKSVY